MYLMVSLPLFGNVRIDAVTITAVHDDGTFVAAGREWQGARCAPDKHQLYNDDGTPAQIAVTPDSADADMMAAVKILLGGS